MKPLFSNSTTFLLSVAVISLSACSEKPKKPAKTPVETHIAPPKSAPTPTPVQTQLTPEDLGKKIYTRCRACHTLDAGGRHKVGPNLHNIFDRAAGSAEGYAYSKAMVASDIIWTDETLSAYLERPSAYIPKNKMAFAGLRKQSDRDNLIAYLKANTGK